MSPRHALHVAVSLAALTGCSSSQSPHEPLPPVASVPPASVAPLPAANVAPPPPASARSAAPAAPRNAKVCAVLKAAEDREGDLATNPPKFASFTSGACEPAAKKFDAALKKVVPATSADVAEIARRSFRCALPWATSLEQAKFKDGELTGRLEVVHLDAKGKPDAAGQALFEPDPKKSNFRVKVADHIDAIVDFRVERLAGAVSALAVTWQSVEHEGGARRRGQLWRGPVPSAAASAPGTFIETVPDADALLPTGFADLDGDGRLEVLYRAPFEAMVTSASGADYPFGGPTFAAHALADDTFAVGDALAKDVASCACPGPPDLATLRGDGNLLSAIACARVWQADAAGEAEAVCARKDDAPAACASKAVRALAGASPKVSLP